MHFFSLAKLPNLLNKSFNIPFVCSYEVKSMQMVFEYKVKGKFLGFRVGSYGIFYCMISFEMCSISYMQPWTWVWSRKQNHITVFLASIYIFTYEFSVFDSEYLKLGYCHSIFILLNNSEPHEIIEGLFLFLGNYMLGKNMFQMKMYSQKETCIF